MGGHLERLRWDSVQCQAREGGVQGLRGRCCRASRGVVSRGGHDRRGGLTAGCPAGVTARRKPNFNYLK